MPEFIKYVDFLAGDNSFDTFSLIHPNSLVKTAGISLEIEDFVNTLNQTSDDKIYALINALGAYEYYGSNRNADAFYEEDLIKKHHTFVDNGYVYLLHQNKDPKKSLGKVLFSHYNKDMHRVELVVELDLKNPEVQKILEKIEKGDLVHTSMGSKQKYDVCSICGHKSKSRKEYCIHLKTQLGHILPDGRKVFAINPDPNFFDISVVVIPADKTSSFMKLFNTKKSLQKITENDLKKLDTMDNNTYIKVASYEEGTEKTGDIIKKIDIKPEDVKVDPKKLIELSGEKLGNELIAKLAQYPFNETLSTLLALRIIPKPDEFQKLALYNAGYKEYADYLESIGKDFTSEKIDKAIIIDGVGVENFNEKIAQLLVDRLPELVFTKKMVVARGLMKQAQYLPPKIDRNREEPSQLRRMLFGYTPSPPISPIKSPLIPLSILGGLYFGYSRLFNETKPSTLRELIVLYPWLVPLFIAAGVMATTSAQSNSIKLATAMDRFVISSFITFPTSYYLSGVNQIKANAGIPITSNENFIREHPALVALTGSMIGTMSPWIFKKSYHNLTKLGQYLDNLSERQVDDLYTQLTT